MLAHAGTIGDLIRTLERLRAMGAPAHARVVLSEQGDAIHAEWETEAFEVYSDAELARPI